MKSESSTNRMTTSNEDLVDMLPRTKSEHDMVEDSPAALKEPLLQFDGTRMNVFMINAIRYTRRGE